MATVVNARDIAIDGASHITVTIPGNSGWSQVTDDNGNKPSDNADPTQDTIVAGITVTGGGITLSAGGSIKGGQTGYATGTGWFLGYSGGAYKFSIGDSTKYLKWDGSAMTFAGNLTGAGDITWTGTAKFNGVVTAGGVQVALVANDSLTQDYGLYSPGNVTGVYATGAGSAGSGSIGVRGTSSNSGCFGVSGETSAGTGVKGTASSGVGVQANASTGTALKLTLSGAGKLIEVPAAKLSTGANTPAFTNSPGAGSVTWIPVFDDAGTKYWIPAVQN